ncbi:protein of unknown function [Paraburkholderia kururiensis]
MRLGLPRRDAREAVEDLAPGAREAVQRVDKPHGFDWRPPGFERCKDRSEALRLSGWNVAISNLLDLCHLHQPSRTTCGCCAVPTSEAPIVAPGKKFGASADAIRLKRMTVEPARHRLLAQIPEIARDALRRAYLRAAQPKPGFKKPKQAQGADDRLVQGVLIAGPQSTVEFQSKSDMHE